jgi:hypothetical protein
MPASIQIQGNLLNTSVNIILEQSPRLGDLTSNSGVYIKQSVSLNAIQSALSNLVSLFIYCLKNLFIYYIAKNYYLFITNKEKLLF